MLAILAVAIWLLAGRFATGPGPALPRPTEGAPSSTDFAVLPGPVTETGIVIPMAAPVGAVAFSPDGKMLAAAQREAPGGVRVWALPSGKPLRLLWGGQAIRSLAFSHDSHYLAAAGEAGGVGGVKIWHFPKGTAQFLIPSSSVDAVAISANGLLAISYVDGKDPRVVLGSLSSQELRPLPGVTLPVRMLAFSPDGRALATGSDDRRVIVWEPSSATKMRELQLDPSINALAWAASGRLGIATQDRLHYWSPINAKHDLSWPEKPGVDIRTITFSSDSRLAVSSGWQGRNVGALFHRDKFTFQWLYGHQDAIESFAFSPDNAMLASGSADRTVRMWDIRRFAETGKPLPLKPP
jgi:WD40 repeat protein